MSYLFYQGKGASQVQAARYIGSMPMITTTGESALLKSSGVFVIPRERLWVYSEIPEINRKTNLFNFISRIKHRAQGMRVTRPSPETRLDYQPLYRRDEPGSENSLGQTTDIAAHKAKYNALMNTMPKPEKIVLYGVSHRYENQPVSAQIDSRREHLHGLIIQR